jgi:very-short-patch-repair endonuclease/endogenous inhibitor of DNA gyrase (YacG/DUF329 family)
MYIRICPICNTTFETEHSRKEACSPACARRLFAYKRGESIACPVCGKQFFPARRSDRPQRACSPSCGAILRARKETPEQKRNRGSPLPPLIFTCRACGKTFTDKKRKKDREYCSRRCTALGTVGANRGWVPDADWREQASARMRVRNPSKDPETRDKMNASLRGRTFPGARGGNGQHTPQQKALLQALGEGWISELGIGNHATNWKVLVVDIGHPDWKIAIEVDGHSHQTKKQKNRDALKEKYLLELGWTLIRLWNSEVDRDVWGCVERVLALHQS